VHELFPLLTRFSLFRTPSDPLKSYSERGSSLRRHGKSSSASMAAIETSLHYPSEKVLLHANATHIPLPEQQRVPFSASRHAGAEGQTNSLRLEAAISAWTDAHPRPGNHSTRGKSRSSLTSSPGLPCDSLSSHCLLLSLLTPFAYVRVLEYTSPSLTDMRGLMYLFSLWLAPPRSKH
jgi:hypothetical protein